MKREIVLPGSLLITGNNLKAGLYTFKEDSSIYAGLLGLFERDSIKDKGVVNIIPLKGKYYPKEGDNVIGIIVKTHLFSWLVDINSFVYAILPFANAVKAKGKKKVKKFELNLANYLSIGDVIYAKIVSFDRNSPPILSLKEKKGLGKVTSGFLLNISPAKIPRFIGKKLSMINMIREKLGIKIIVGRNGRIIAFTDDENKIEILKKIIEKIELESHTSGLTDRIKMFLESVKNV
jgi:RNA-binding protein Rrp4 and related proteins (contain S1 domain and KH domain)